MLSAGGIELITLRIDDFTPVYMDVGQCLTIWGHLLRDEVYRVEISLTINSVWAQHVQRGGASEGERGSGEGEEGGGTGEGGAQAAAR